MVAPIGVIAETVLSVNLVIAVSPDGLDSDRVERFRLCLPRRITRVRSSFTYSGCDVETIVGMNRAY
jgi:hypothetical protein